MLRRNLERGHHEIIRHRGVGRRPWLSSGTCTGTANTTRSLRLRAWRSKRTSGGRGGPAQMPHPPPNSARNLLARLGISRQTVLSSATICPLRFPDQGSHSGSCDTDRREKLEHWDRLFWRTSSRATKRFNDDIGHCIAFLGILPCIVFSGSTIVLAVVVPIPCQRPSAENTNLRHPRVPASPARRRKIGGVLYFPHGKRRQTLNEIGEMLAHVRQAHGDQRTTSPRCGRELKGDIVRRQRTGRLDRDPAAWQCTTSSCSPASRDLEEKSLRPSPRPSTHTATTYGT